MSRSKDQKDISDVLFQYCPRRSTNELEKWLTNLFVLLEKNKESLDNNFELTFHYNQTYIVFLTKNNIFNFTQITDEGLISECSLPLTIFLQEAFAISRIEEVKNFMVLSDEFEFRCIAILLADEIIQWDATTTLSASFATYAEHKTKLSNLKFS